MRQRILAFSIIPTLFVLFVLHSSSVRAETLRIGSDRPTMQGVLPLSLTITLTLAQEDVEQSDRRNEFDLPISILQRRLHAVLLDDAGATILRTMLFVEWNTPRGGDPFEFDCTGIGFLGARSKPGNSRSDPWELVAPGAYSVVVEDRRNSLESNPIRINILAPTARERLAADVFLDNYPEGVQLIMEHKASEAAATMFQHLATDFGDTYVGRIAKLALALRRAMKITTEHGGAPNAPVWRPIAAEISAALKDVDANDPLRSEALFELCAARARSAELDNARIALAELEGAKPRGKWARMGRRLVKEAKVLHESHGQGSGGD